jgi:hypothetical protein
MDSQVRSSVLPLVKHFGLRREDVLDREELKAWMLRLNYKGPKAETEAARMMVKGGYPVTALIDMLSKIAQAQDKESQMQLMCLERAMKLWPKNQRRPGAETPSMSSGNRHVRYTPGGLIDMTRQHENESFTCAEIVHLDMSSSEEQGEDEGESEVEDECDGEEERLDEGDELDATPDGAGDAHASSSGHVFGRCPFQQQSHTHVLTVSVPAQQQRAVQLTWQDLVESWASSPAQSRVWQARMQPLVDSSSSDGCITFAFSTSFREHGRDVAACHRLSLTPVLTVPGVVLLSTLSSIGGLPPDPNS